MTILDEIDEIENQLIAIKAKLDNALTPGNVDEIVELKLSKGEIATLLGAVELVLE